MTAAEQQVEASRTRACMEPACPHSLSAPVGTAAWTPTANTCPIFRPSLCRCAGVSATTGRSLKVGIIKVCICEAAHSENIQKLHNSMSVIFLAPRRALPRENHHLSAIFRKPLHHRRPQLGRSNRLQVSVALGERLEVERFGKRQNYFSLFSAIRYYNWSTAAPLMLAMQAFQKPLPKVRI